MVSTPLPNLSLKVSFIFEEDILILLCLYNVVHALFYHCTSIPKDIK